MKILTKNNIEKLPESPGVYFLKTPRGSSLYIGKAINLKKRVKNHFTRPTFWDKNFIDQVSKIAYIKTGSEIEALLLESQLIKSHKPKYNIMLRDDKQYFYVGFSRDKLPNLITTHQPAKNIRYIGPFTDGRSLKLVLKYLRKVFPYYTSQHRKLPCSYCHIDLCPGPNPGTTEYRKNISKIKSVLRGQKPRVITSLKKEMAQLTRVQNFEKAAKVRDQIMALKNIFAHKGRSSILLSGGFEGCFGMVPRRGQNSPSLGGPRWRDENDARKQISDTFPLINISSIESYDISNIQGKEPVASMVRFDKGKPNKSMYRKFKIRLPEKPNDVAMIREVIRRRLAHTEWPYPDLFLIDGGRGQLNAALRQCQMSNVKCQIVSLAKKPDRLFFPGQSRGIPLTKLPQELNHLLTYARDEAHRFAITYHRKLHRRTFK